MGIHQAYLQQVKLNINGIVQGVGFRPFVYQLATKSNLVGTVLNNDQGVCIHLQGLNTDINQVVHKLRVSPPPLARIDSLNVMEEQIDSKLSSFSIISSSNTNSSNADNDSNQGAIVSISADKSTCVDCLTEIFDPNDRHYQYPFTNCTNCGPRYSIVKQLPYDRHLTSMASFTMCDECQQAYNDPMNRRYHAQPVSCPQCGPRLSYSSITYGVKSEAVHDQAAILKEAVEALNQGQILAIKGLGGFHIICDATNDAAVATLRQRKQRPAKPFAIMAANIVQARQLVVGSNMEWRVLDSAEKPITLMTKNSNTGNLLSSLIAPDIDKLGIFLAYTPLHHLLLKAFNKPLVATSANISGLPIITKSSDILAKLGHVIDGIVDHNRPIINACDDSVVQLINNQIQVIRLARGYAPLSIPLPNKLKQAVLGVGAQQKNTQCFAFNQNAFISPHIGDLNNLETNQLFQDTINTFNRLYRFEAEQIITDKHPDYACSQWANTQKTTPVSSVQHHHAHILSVLAVNNYQEPVLGFSFDGTGLGDDDALWGSECLIADGTQFKNVGHFSSFKLIGGEQAIKQPVRILLALLFEHYTLKQIQALPISAIQKMTLQTITNLHRMWLGNIACIECRSVGRVFDAVAVALNLIETNEFESQAGMLIEAQANRWSTEILDNTVLQLADSQPSASTPVWDTSKLLKHIIELNIDVNGIKIEQICFEFTNSISLVITDVAAEYPDYALVFSGGVFQNKLLLTLCHQRLNHRNILPSKLVPINDAGISLGQLWYAFLRQNT
ncbi:carbamoyltransferase HypF [Shewanella donghaensis]|uniref:carbamoyltransferase HypF n=1 Tax=Shewanella donghaensis TaxID=238836 RepID=UPI0011834DE0|nr:carbamoyltransferase HypF [Shewanella donghaensis]